MKLTMDSSQYGPEMARNVGDVIDVDKAEGERLLQGGLAHESTKGEIAVADAKAEVAAEADAKDKKEAAAVMKKRKAEAESKKQAEAEAKKAAADEADKATAAEAKKAPDPGSAAALRHTGNETAVDETREKAVE